MQDNNQQQITPSEFSKKIKEKYPQYKDIDDVTLAKKMIEKYPEYSSRVNFNIEKKKSNSTGSQTPKDSQSKATPKPSTSVGGKQPQVKPSVTSSGASNDMYGGLNVLPPASQPSSKKPAEFSKKKSDVKNELLKPKDLSQTLNTGPFGLKYELNTGPFGLIPEKQVTKEQVINNFQYNRKLQQNKDIEELVAKSAKEFDDVYENKGVLNKAEKVVRSSWNNIISFGSKLPLIGTPGAAIKSANDLGLVADKTSIEKYIKQAEAFFSKQGKSVSPNILKEKAKELKIEEDKRNYIENQDSKFLESIKDDVYVDPGTGKKEKVKDLLSLNDYNKYKTLDKETVSISNSLKLKDLELKSTLKDINQTKNVINHQIIYGNFEGATKLYNQLINKDNQSADDRLFIEYYNKNKENASKSPINPNLNTIVEKLNNSLVSLSKEYDNTLKQYYQALENFDKKYSEKVDVYEDFDNSRRSYDNVFFDKAKLSAAETVNGVVKMVETLTELSSELKSKYGLPVIGMDNYLFKKVFDGYNYYDFKNQIDKEKGLIREDVKEVTDTNSFINYVSDVTATQTGQMALPMLAGYGKIAMPLLRQSAVYFSSGFGRGVGEAENYEEKLIRGDLEQGETGKIYSLWEKMLHGSVSGTADIIGNLPTAIRFSKGLDNIMRNPNTKNMFWKSFTKKGLEYGKETGIDLGKELGEETIAKWMQDASKIFVLQDPNAKLTDGTLDLLKDTTTFTLVMKVFPLFGKGVVNRISNTSESKIIEEKEKELGYWKNRVNEEGLSEETKKLYNDKAFKIESELNSTYEKSRKRISEKPVLLKEVEDVNSQIEQKIKEGYSIKDNSELTNAEKTILLKEKELEYSKLIEKRDNILSDQYNPLSYLPEEDSTKLKTRAEKELKAETIASGIEEGKVNIKEEDITKRAIDNYEKQSKETTVEKPTKEGPTGEQEVESTTTTQGQQDKVVQEEKNSVDELRQQELVEFRDQVENAEDFITDGKVDAKKVSESDNAKAKEIYAKYDKLIKPLLTNIKTQEDAIQEQSTGQVPVQSEAIVSEEVEQGKSETKSEVVTEEVKSEEEVTKIKADLYVSKERLKNAFDKYKTVGIAFDPKNQLAKDKELVKALLDYAYNNIRLGKYNAVKLIEDLAKDGIEITRDGAKYIFDRASKRVQKDINKTIGIKPKATEQKRINKAYGIGVATQKVETNKQKDKTKEVKAVVSELKDQIRDIFSSAKEVIRIEKKLTKENRVKLAKDINNLIESKKVSKRRFKALINVINKTDINNPVKFDEVVSYAEKLMQDEMYAEKVSEAKSLISSIKKMSKNKLKDIALVNIARDFSLIKPIKTADIDSLIQIGINIKQALKSTSITTNKTDISKPLDINSIKPAVDAILLEQNKNEESDRIKEMEYYLGVNEGELSVDELEAAIEDTSRKSKMNSEEVRAKILDIYDTTSAIVSEAIKKGEDLFTGDKIEFNNKDLKIVEEILKLDIRDVSKNQNKKIIQLIDVLNNFLVNGESNGLELAYRDVLGEVNAKKVVRKGVVSKGLKFLFGNSAASKVYMQEIISIDKINDVYFKGFETGSYVDKMSGLSDILFYVSKTKKEIYNKLDAYKNKFKDSKPNNEGFFSPYNIVERAMYAFVTRSVDGSQKDVESEFKRRKGIVVDSIDNMMNSNNESLIEKAVIYQKVFDNIIGKSNRAEDIIIDKINKESIVLMRSYWGSYYDDASDLSLSMYNTILGKDVNYVYDSYSEINKKEKDVSGEINENFSFIVNQHITKKKSSTLFEVTRSDLQDNLYINLNFEEANFNAMKETAIDIATTKYNRQMASFLNSESLSKLIPNKDDRDLYRRRIVSYINRVKGRDFVPKDELKSINDTLNALNSFGTALLLGGVTQPLKQTIPAAANTLINAKDLDLSIIFNKDVRDFMKNNGYAVSYRGIESLSNIEESRSSFESINKSKSKAVSKWIQDKSTTYLKFFLGNSDAFIAMASWMTYYKQKTIETKGRDYFNSIDWKTHKPDRDAGDYAQKQLDRQQAPSDVELKGELFSGKEIHKKIASKVLFPLSSFSLNQKARMYNDISTLFAKESFSDNDKKIAAFSLSGLIVEQVIYRAIQFSIGINLLEVAALISGIGDDDDELKEEKEKLKKSMMKGSATSLVIDVFSPIPLTDEHTSRLFNDALDIMYSVAEVKEEDKFFLYDGNSKRKESFVDVVGVGGASIDKALSVRESSIMAIDGTYTTNFNGKKSKRILSEKSKEMMITASTIEAMSFLTLLPSEGFNIANSMKKFAKKQSISVNDKSKFIEEQVGYGYTKEEANKMYEDYIEYLKEELKYKYEE